MDKSFDAKREGYKEFYGTISLYVEQKYFLEISDTLRFPKGLTTNIYSGSNTFIINDNNGKISVESNIKEISNKLFDEPLQSMTSHIHMQAIVNNEPCLLPYYERVYEWHSQIVTMFNDALGIEKGDVCPIT